MIEVGKTHHASITDGNKTLGIIFTDGEGVPNVRAFKAENYPRQALKTSSGEGKYSDLEPPYFAIAQDDFTGGRGNEDYEKDTSRYYDAHWIDTTKENGMVLGGRETYGTGLRNTEVNMPGDLTWQALTGSQIYLAGTFDASASYTTQNVELWLRIVGDPGTLTVSLYNNSGAAPHAILASATITAPAFSDDVLSILQQLTWTGNTTISINSTYWVVLKGAAADDVNNHWEVGTDAATAGQQSTDGSAWGASTMHPYFRITPSNTNMTGMFFEYKRGFYFVPMYDAGGNTKVYMNGDRGLADDNTGNLDRLKDATKSWTADDYNGWKVIITNGPGSEENQNWREITDTTSDYLVVSPNWNVVHTTDTEYVIVGGEKWRVHSDIATVITDVAVMGDYVYFARGENASANILRYQEWNNGGAWSIRTDAENTEAKHLLALRHSSNENMLIGTRNLHGFYGVAVFKGRVPRKWGDMYNDLGQLVDTTKPWDARVNANITHSTDNGATKLTIAAGFATGIIAAEDLPVALDITAAKKIGFLIKSSIDTDAGDLRFIYDDYPELGQEIACADMWHLDDPLAAGAGPTYVDMDEAIDGDEDTEKSITMTSDDYLVIGGSVPFNQIIFDLDEVNDNAATMAAQYFNGSEWIALTITDNTADSGATLNQDRDDDTGNITFTIPNSWVANTVNSVEAYFVRLQPSGNLDAVGFRLVTLKRQNNTNLDIDGLTAGQWYYQELDITPLGNERPDATSIQSVGMDLTTNLAAQTIRIRDVRLLSEEVDHDATNTFSLPSSFRINGIERYSGSTDDPVENPWIFTEDRVYEMQTQASDQIVPIPLREMGTLQSSENGIAHTVAGTYLYFNLGEKIERYFNRTLDDIGPDRDSGLPAARQGIPRDLTSYPGKVLAAIDANTGTSSIMGLKGEAWCEIYRAPRATERIRALYVQAVPGSNVSRLWFVMGSDLAWVPISLNPYYDSDYDFTHEGHLITAWNYANLQDVRKSWKSLKLFLEDVNDNRYIIVDYQLDDETTWTEIGRFDDVPVKELDVDSWIPSARRIRYRLRFYTDDEDETPRMKALVSEGVAFVPVKLRFGMTTVFKEREEDLNLLNEIDRTWESAEEKYDWIMDLANDGTTVKFRHYNAIYDDKIMFLDPATTQALIGPSHEKREKYGVQITAVEV